MEWPCREGVLFCSTMHIVMCIIVGCPYPSGVKGLQYVYTPSLTLSLRDLHPQKWPQASSNPLWSLLLKQVVDSSYGNWEWEGYLLEVQSEEP